MGFYAYKSNLHIFTHLPIMAIIKNSNLDKNELKFELEKKYIQLIFKKLLGILSVLF